MFSSKNLKWAKKTGLLNILAGKTQLVVKYLKSFLLLFCVGWSIPLMTGRWQYHNCELAENRDLKRLSWRLWWPTMKMNSSLLFSSIIYLRVCLTRHWPSIKQKEIVISLSYLHIFQQNNSTPDFVIPNSRHIFIQSVSPFYTLCLVSSLVHIYCLLFQN